MTKPLGVVVLAALFLGCSSSSPGLDASTPNHAATQFDVSVRSVAKPRVSDATLIQLPNLVLAIAGSDEPGCFLWSTDGATASRLVQLSTETIRCVAASSITPLEAVTVRDDAYFLWGNERGESTEFWRSNGTVAGTRRLMPPARAEALHSLADRVLFLAPVGGNLAGHDLWQYLPASDTFQKLISLGVPQGPARFRTSGVLGTTTLISTYSFGAAVIQTDGTPAGTRLRSDFPFAIGPMVQQGGRLVFLSVGGLLMGTDGTDAGTLILDRGEPWDGGEFVSLGDLRRHGDRIVYPRVNRPSPVVPESEYELRALDPGATAPASLGVTSGSFRGWVGELRGSQLFATSTDASFSVRALAPDAGVSAFFSSAAAEPFNGEPQITTDAGAFFLRVGPFNPFGPSNSIWATNGSPEGTGKLMQTGATKPVAVANGRALLFDGVSLFSSDGTPSGTRAYAALVPGDAPKFWRLGERALFITELPKRALWAFDGAAVELAELRSPGQGSLVQGGLFATLDGSELLITDGTVAGTRRVPVTVAAAQVLWVSATEVFTSSGTESGPDLLTRFDLVTGTQTQVPGLHGYPCGRANGKLVLTQGEGLYAVDATTSAVTPISGGPFPGVASCAEDGPSLLFADNTGVWTTDGTTATRLGETRSEEFAYGLRRVDGEVYALVLGNPSRVIRVRDSLELFPETFTQFSLAVAGAAGRAVFVTGQGKLLVHDPSAGTTFEPVPGLTQASLPADSAPTEPGFFFGGTLKGSAQLFYFDKASNSAAPVSGARNPRQFSSAAGHPVFWAADPLGWALFTAK